MNSRFWLVLFVAASLLPWRVAFACSHDAQVLHQRCCCKDAVTRCPKIKTGKAGCCTLVAVPTQQLGDPESLAQLSPDTSKNGKSPAPPPSLPTLVAPWTEQPIARSATISEAPWLQGSLIYLQTARLRL